MAETFDINSLLSNEELQRMAMRPFSPSFYRQEDLNQVTHGANDFTLRFHFYTGRVPTPAEFYYGMYFDKKGQSHSDVGLSMPARYCGYMSLITSGKSDSSYGSVGPHAKMSGMQHPAGKEPASHRDDFTAVPVNAQADLSWLTDISFSVSNEYTLSSGELNALKGYVTAGKWVGEQAPTFFFLTKNHNAPVFTQCNVKTPDANINAGVVSYLNTSYIERRPLAMGTVGGFGSGATLELSKGYDFSGVISPISLRAQCQIT
ncbi:hypothetical protein [Pseudoalteromonas umbrosa]|uniref:hypothetical protein n=1 Tax=Pseudoalteromonas umbrosa TaxID=3048489 RepID=UPI0024C27048|nr:hypothetical protein [Pseudoalteromonas sp. B95]MDK1290079.1 hypothetical protein [Pseudoalteromonas sp. B95]